MKRRLFREALFLPAALIAFLGFFLYAEAARDAVKEALLLAVNALIPSLFPAMTVSSFLIESELLTPLSLILDKPMRFFFRLPGTAAPAVILGFLAGYPVGARTAAALYRKGFLSRSEAERLLGFSNNSGPAFILGTVGLALFSSRQAGIVLMLAHLAAGLLLGILFSLYKRREPLSPPVLPGGSRPSFPAAFTEAVRSSALSLLSVTGFVVFFSAAVRVLHESRLLPRAAALAARCFPLSAGVLEGFFTGLIEMTGGLAKLAPFGAEHLALAAFLLGWAGLSVHFQVLSFLGECRLSVRPYLLGKFLHGVLSAAFASLLSSLLPVPAAAGSVLPSGVPGFGAALAASAAAPMLLLTAACFFRLRGKKSF